MTEKTSPRRYNNYSLAIILSFLAGIAITLVLLLTAHSALGEMPQWLYELLCAIFGMVSVSQIVSGSGYSSTGFDILTNGDVTLVQVAEKALIPSTKKISFLNFMSERKMEFVGLLIGFLVALALTIALAVKKAADIFASLFPVVGTIVFFLTNVSAISGLCSRLGRCSDYFRANGKGLRGRNVNYVLAVLAGAVIGIILASVFIGVAGVTSVMTAGGAIPLWFGGAVFFITTVSSCASASGYIGRAVDFFLGQRILGMSKSENDRGLKSRVNAERVGTVIGIALGIALGITLIATGLVLVPFFGMGLPVWAAGLLVMVGLISAMGGLGNRLGYCVDLLRGHRGDNEHTIDITSSDSSRSRPGSEHSPSEYNDPSVLNRWENPGQACNSESEDDYDSEETTSLAVPVSATTEYKMEIIEPEIITVTPKIPDVEWLKPTIEFKSKFKHDETPSFGRSKLGFHKPYTDTTLIPKAESSELPLSAAPAA
ncbi:MAG: hypothetical protein SFW07_01155 [Gammaproteobacteria bacterium]|nr:hypothetical protein [Gammaproteobacteria bacterium]